MRTNEQKFHEMIIFCLTFLVVVFLAFAFLAFKVLEDTISSRTPDKQEYSRSERWIKEFDKKAVPFCGQKTCVPLKIIEHDYFSQQFYCNKAVFSPKRKSTVT